MIKRFVEEDIFAWKGRADRKPLVLMGARQVGKTWLMRDFGRKHFAHVHEFNFDDTPDLSSVFEGTKDPTSILARLAAISGAKIDIGRDVVIFDEIQECGNALRQDGAFVNIPLYLASRFANCLPPSVSPIQNVERDKKSWIREKP